MARDILKSSVQNASFSIIFQILFRIITFVLNAFIIRTVGQDVLGIMNVRLLLLESTILFLSKEPIMRACLTDTKSHNWAQVMNQIWLSVPFSGVLSIILVYVWIYFLSPIDDIYTHQYKIGCYAVAVSCVVDQLSQSVVLVAQSFCFVKLKVVLETIYIITRTFIFVFFVVRHPDQAINAFSIAQVVSSVILCSLYYSFFVWYISKLNKIKKSNNEKYKHSLPNGFKNMFSDMNDFPFQSIWEFLPGYMHNKDSVINKELFILTLSFSKQSVVKQVLTEGERYVMTVSPVMTFSEQSLYDIVNNLGSLAARFIFRPIEDSAYFYFTQMIKRDVPVTKQEEKCISESAVVLSQLIRVVTSIGLVVVVFGQSYSYTLLYLYGGQKLIESGLSVILLRFHSFAIVLLAINGVTEGYVNATMNSVQLDRYNYIMVCFSISFLLISYVLTNIFGPVGFIMANCINMLARIIHSINYIHDKYKETKYEPLEGLLPGKKFLSALILSGIFTKISEGYFAQSSIMIHILIGSIFFGLTLSSWAYENTALLKYAYDKYKRRLSIKVN